MTGRKLQICNAMHVFLTCLRYA